MSRVVPVWLTSTPIAHRGLHGDEYPENSLGAFRAAAEAGYAIELDIHHTLDGEPIVFHDDTTDRLTEKSVTVRETRIVDLQHLEIKASGYRIPSLVEVFETVAGRVPILIEVKPGTPANKICPKLVSLIDGYDGLVAVQSFDPLIIRWLRKHAPQIVRGQLSTSLRRDHKSFFKKTIWRGMALNPMTRPDFMACDVRFSSSLPVRYWQKLLKVQLLLWTVKNSEDLEKATAAGANVIFERVQPVVKQ
jgi:glycerophosphoryl diester phosphodiesterase